MSTPTQAVQKAESKFVEFVPFGAQDKIKLGVEMVRNLIAVKTKSGKTCSEADAIKFVAMCQARRLNPFEGDAFLIGYDNRDGGATFSLITAHQAFLKRAELHPEYDGMKSGIIVQNEDNEMKDLEGDFFVEGQKLLGGWATIYFKNRKQPMHKRLRLKRFQKSFGIWMEDPAGMICKCAEADALRSSFPTMLGGLYLREEIEVTAPVNKASSPIFEAKIAQEPPAPVQTTPETQKPQGGAAAAEASPLATIREKLAKSKVSEGALVDFLIGIGIADEGSTSLESIALIRPDVLDMVLNQYDDMIERVKGS